MSFKNSHSGEPSPLFDCGPQGVGRGVGLSGRPPGTSASKQSSQAWGLPGAVSPLMTTLAHAPTPPGLAQCVPLPPHHKGTRKPRAPFTCLRSGRASPQTQDLAATQPSRPLTAESPGLPSLSPATIHPEAASLSKSPATHSLLSTLPGAGHTVKKAGLVLKACPVYLVPLGTPRQVPS